MNPRRLWFGALARAGIYRRLLLAERPLSEPLPEVAPSMAAPVALLAVEQLDAYRAFRPDQDPEEVRRRLGVGQVCMVAWREGRIIGAAWLTARRVRLDYLHRDLELAPDEVFLYDGYTLPAFRGLRASPVRTAWALRYARDRRYQRLLAAVLPENRSARPLWSRVGYHRLGVIGYVKVGPWRRDFLRLRPGGRPPGTRLA